VGDIDATVVAHHHKQKWDADLPDCPDHANQKDQGDLRSIYERTKKGEPMKHEEGTFNGADGLELFYQSWLPDGDPKATIVIVHGMGEHGGRYPHVVKALVPKGFAIYAADHRGHGRSQGKRMFVESWSDYLDDLHIFVQKVKGWGGERPVQSLSKRPFFLYGHSMGGNITLNTVLRHPDGYNGVIASAPAVGKLDIPPVLALISRALSRLAPALQVKANLEISDISRDPAEAAAYANDPLVQGFGTPRFAVEIASSAEWAMAHAAEFKPPLLMVHGDGDNIVNIASSRNFFAKVIQQDKKLIEYEGGVHESHNDTHRDEVIADIEQWLEAHL
jgi:alpha-beta hydrolase superfamily lysophospholipase